MAARMAGKHSWDGPYIHQALTQQVIYLLVILSLGYHSHTSALTTIQHLTTLHEIQKPVTQLYLHADHTHARCTDTLRVTST